MFKSLFKSETIEFLCDEEDFGVIPEPYSAKKLMPDWYKSLPMKTGNGLNASTVKRCNPFLDSMSIGWIIPLAADVEIESNEDCSGVNYKWDFYKTVIQNHNMNQVSSEKCPNPTFPKPPIKFLNYWLTKCPPGYSLLFTPPLNRPDPRFTCFSGLVDCDKYFEFVNFPFVWNEPNFHGILPAGTPLVQVIPIKRSSLIKAEAPKQFSLSDIAELNKTRKKRQSHESLYRDNLWEKK